MDIHTDKLSKNDHKKAIQFAIEGMHFDWYFDNHILLYLYGRYFWYSELIEATQIIAVYEDNELLGILLAKVNGEEEKYKSFWNQFYVSFFNFLQHTFSKKGAGAYETANQQMYHECTQCDKFDGTILFLATHPQHKGKGIGSLLLKEFESREIGKRIYLYTDNACSYQFYEYKGFELSSQRDIVLDMDSKQVPLKCFLYSKIISIEE